ncbi:hypothetical protein [Microbacterium hydrothermale]|uniref:hypothetical protein n=1 Tax=Microbacterium hydrothermale TaxID=857427 RepID=UPI0010A7E374|nr:hypothetical protein [Microbacterium hydrothermale]
MTAALRTPPRWGETLVGSHKIRAACRFVIAPEVAAQAVADVSDALRAEGFDPAEAPEGVVVLRRGNLIGDTILNGTGLTLITKRLGPLSVKAIVVIHAAPSAQDAEVTVSMLAGNELAPVIAEAVDAVIDRLLARGIPVAGPGWTRSVDLPRENIGHPRTAREHGLPR